MFASIKNMFKRNSPKSPENKKNQSSLLLAAFISLLEDILFWRKLWLTLLFICLFHVIFIICVYQEVNLLQFICLSCAMVISIDAFEAWLKHKHRTNCLRRLSRQEVDKISSASAEFNNWMAKKCNNLIYLRDINHTKAFLLIQIFLGLMFFTGKYTSGYTIIYFLFMFICFLHKIIPPITKVLRKIQQTAESDAELEGLIPDISDANMDLLSIEPEIKPVIDEKQSLDYWKPMDVSLEEASDSSDNSSSLVTNLSADKMHSLDRDVETSDSSEDEYIPRDQQHEQFQSTLEVQPVSTWSGAAYNVLSNLSGAVVNMVYTREDKRRQRVSSIDSSDGFEMIDKNDVM
ncbi:uncharacterized protein [Epargyreus clarus]|uniref:uncharacterized protein n=1 Tax=Epargyreus clarus TaxID=520877 RepID=UPI003C2D028A